MKADYTFGRLDRRHEYAGHKDRQTASRGKSQWWHFVRDS